MDGKGKNLPLIKEKNSNLIKQTIYRYSPISRIGVAQRLSLANATITSNVVELMKQGLVREIGVPQAAECKGMGRPPILLEFITDSRYVVGVELNPYETVMAATDLRGKVVRRWSQVFAEASYVKMAENLSSSVRAFLKRSGVPQEKIVGIGVCLPGFVDGGTGIVHNNLRQDWVARNLAKDLESRLLFPVCIENNVRARTIGADLFSRRVDGDPLLHYFISYGIACTLVSGGQILTGKAAGAGEIGHMVVEIGGPICDVCGNQGCLDALASEHAVLKRCQAAMDAGLAAMLQEIVSARGKLDMDAVLQAQVCGDPQVTSILNDSIRYIGVSIANLMNFISPETVLIDGRIFSVAENRDRLLSILPRNIFGGSQKGYQLKFMDYDPLGGAKGAAALAVKRFVLGA